MAAKSLLDNQTGHGEDSCSDWRDSRPATHVVLLQRTLKNIKPRASFLNFFLQASLCEAAKITKA